MPANITTTICNGELVAEIQEQIQERMEKFAETYPDFSELFVSVDLEKRTKPVVEIKALIDEQELIGAASGDGAVQALDYAIRRLERRMQEADEEPSEEEPKARAKPKGRDDRKKDNTGLAVALILLAGIAVFNIQRMGLFSSVEQPPMYTVKGKVTLDGEPVPRGRIAFVSPDALAKGMPPGGGEIIDGNYKVLGWPGSVTVAIYAPEEVGEPDETGVKETVETIPEQYNVDSTLTATIEKSHSNEFNFDLQSDSKDN